MSNDIGHAIFELSKAVDSVSDFSTLPATEAEIIALAGEATRLWNIIRHMPKKQGAAA